MGEYFPYQDNLPIWKKFCKIFIFIHALVHVSWETCILPASPGAFSPWLVYGLSNLFLINDHDLAWWECWPMTWRSKNTWFITWCLSLWTWWYQVHLVLYTISSFLFSHSKARCPCQRIAMWFQMFVLKFMILGPSSPTYYSINPSCSSTQKFGVLVNA